MLIAFAALGQARTTRQGRGAAVAAAIVALVLTRVAGFAASSAAVRTASAVPFVYGAPGLACLLSLLVIFQGPRAAGIEARIRERLAALADSLLPTRLRGA
jgi:lipopolysaccharide export system permease protein